MNIFSKMTLRNLRINRTRTVVTILGILLSTAMFTAVTTTISSLRQFLIDYASYEDGTWHIEASDFSAEDLSDLKDNSKVGQIVTLKEYGFSRLEDGRNPNKPYLYVCGMSENATELLPIHLTDGRLPADDSEILLPKHFVSDSSIAYEIGDTISLDIGRRLSGENVRLTNHDGYYLDNGEGKAETISDVKNSTYTIVGFYERPTFEDYQAAGYTALTLLSEDAPASADDTYEVFFCMKNRNDASRFFSNYSFPEGSQSKLNYSLLRYYGASGESAFNAVLYSLGLILIVIILFGSVALIYNSFSISINERTKQLGILSSLGATKKQLMKSVTSEGFFLSVIGIPLGILSGLFGIGVTFFLLQDKFRSLVSAGEHITLSLHPSVPALVLAVLLSLFTIYLSAYLPARKALKHTAIEVIRQSDEIKISPKKVKISKLSQKLFGFEGTLSLKNFKRNRRKYRATVFSLFISIVLFISASSFAAYLMESVGSVYENYDYDVALSLYPDETVSSLPADTLKKTFSTMEEIADSSYYTQLTVPLGVNTAAYSASFLEAQKESWSLLCPDVTPEREILYSHIVFVEDTVFKEYLKEHGIDPDGYFDTDAPKAILVDHMERYSGTDERYHIYDAIGQLELADFTFQPVYAYQGLIDYTWYQEADGKFYCDYYDTSDDDEGDALTIPFEEASASITVNCDTILADAPAMSYNDTYNLTFYYPYSQIDALFLDCAGKDFSNLPAAPLSAHAGLDLTFSCENHTAVAETLRQWLDEHPRWSGHVSDYAESTEEDMAIITIINVFCYGFIVLISFIAAANVFNTISTNIKLRRREFAMLQSIGMTPKSFQKMMNLECFFYGIKGLLYGLPAAFLITYFIYLAVANGMEMDFFVPWYSVLIAVLSVFVVVFSTMVYSMRKQKKENTIDALKDESF